MKPTNDLRVIKAENVSAYFDISVNAAKILAIFWKRRETRVNADDVMSFNKLCEFRENQVCAKHEKFKMQIENNFFFVERQIKFKLPRLTLDHARSIASNGFGRYFLIDGFIGLCK